MVGDDTDYYRQRAATESLRATEASTDEVAAIHEELAKLYKTLANHEELRGPTRLVLVS